MNKYVQNTVQESARKCPGATHFFSNPNPVPQHNKARPRAERCQRLTSGGRACHSLTLKTRSLGGTDDITPLVRSVYSLSHDENEVKARSSSPHGGEREYCVSVCVCVCGRGGGLIHLSSYVISATVLLKSDISAF